MLIDEGAAQTHSLASALDVQDVSHVHALSAILLAAFTLITILHDALSSINWPKRLLAVAALLSSPFQNFLTIDDLKGIGSSKTPAVWKIRALTALAFVNSVGWLAFLAYALAIDDAELAVQALVSTITWIYLSLRMSFRRPSTPPYMSILLAALHVITGLFSFGLGLMEEIDFGAVVLDALRIFVAGLFISLAGTLPLQCMLSSENVAGPDDIPSAKLSSPEDNATLWSWCTFSFVEPLFDLASVRTLHETDVWTLSPYFLHRNIFSKYLAYQAQYPKHSLLRFLIVSNSLDLIIDLTLEMWSAVVGFVPAYALQKILASLEHPSPAGRNTAYFWTLVTFIAHLSFAQKDLLQTWHTRRCYERTRGQLFCALHYKALKRRDISGKIGHGLEGKEGEGQAADLGRIVNLMQGDTYAVSQRFWDFSGVFAAPVRLVIALVFLYRVLGWSALSGIVVVIVAYVLNYPLARYNIWVTRSSWKARDTRMNVVNELLQNIRFLKYYGWENFWADKAHKAREDELKWRVKENIVNTIIAFIWTWMPSATALTSFLCYTLIAKERLTVAKAFTSIALFSQLQEPMTALPAQFFAFLHAYVSMQRFEQFLAEGEVPEWASPLKAAESGCESELALEKDIGFDNASFEWYGPPREALSPSRFTLGPLDVLFPKGKLTLVSGATGSGKSALLAALLGEMQGTGGSVKLDKMGHHVAFCAQNPWLEHATIRENIIFGAMGGYNESRYHAVIDACALVPDLEVLEAGDSTEIGEKGITLSGGQRARIALARAMYSQAKCILLDDPLAAVDMHTAVHLVSNCLSGPLAQDRTIILVTHHICLCLPIASYLVELAQGKIFHKGTIQELRERGQLDEVLEAEDETPETSGDEPLAAVEGLQNEADNIKQGPVVNRVKRQDAKKLIEAEARAEGRVSWLTYITYIRAAGIFSWVLTVCLMLLIRAINIGNQVFLAQWGGAYNDNQAEMSAMSALTFKTAGIPLLDLPSPDVNVKPWLMIYFYISLAGATSVFAYIGLGYYASLQASRVLFVALLNRLSRAPARFFDITPIGRILNRFTSDINTVDGALQNSARAALSGVLNFAASFGVIVVVVPTFAPFALFIAWLYIRLAPQFVRTSRDLRRLELVSLSPAFAGFDELLRGLAHVRAFGMEAKYQESFYKKIDKFQSFDHVYWLVSAWLRWRYDCLGSLVVFMTTIFALWKGVGNGSTAIVIVQAGIFAEASRQLVKVLAQLELDYNSVERIVEYLGVPQEAPAIIEGSRPPAYWPSNSGSLVVDGLTIKYAPDLPAVLHNISFTVKPSEKIGVVGRTGSGKSTLALSLLRMVEPTGGRILIDGLDITAMGLEDLRTRITIVSQDVSLFSGTIRSNLDPFGEHTDQECWDVLDRCHLTPLLNRNPELDTITLDMPISQGGSLSAGERQLMALARAVLRRTNIIIMDEATSQIDSRLDEQIQKTIREELAGALVITIAHRLKTIIDYDRILVLDAGQVAEFGEPRELLLKAGGLFREMCKKSADWPLFASLLNEGQS